MRLLIVTVVATFLSVSTYASESSLRLGEWMNEEILASQDAIVMSGANDGAYNSQLSTIRFRLRPSIGLEIDFIAKAKLKPEIELYWKK